MPKQEKRLAKKPGRPATGRGKTIGVRLHPPALVQLDRWIAQQPGKVSRPEGIRRLIERGLAAEAAEAGKKPAGGKAK